MATKKQVKLPKYRQQKYKKGKLAFVELNGHRHYLGKYGSRESKQKYERLLAEWIENGKNSQVDPNEITVVEVIARFWEHALQHYRRLDGKQTCEVSNFRQSLRPLKELYGDSLSNDFGPLALKAVRQRMIDKGWCRSNVNKCIGRIKHVFKWAVENEIVAPSTYHGLQAVAGLKYGRSKARESDPIKPVANGADDFGITSGPQLLQARASGVPVIAIGSVIPKSPIGWIAKKDSGILKPQHFINKKIGAQHGTHTEITLKALCAKLGISLDSFQRIPVKFNPHPFIVGDVDILPVYIIDQPVDLEREGIELNVIDPGDYGVSLAYGNVYFTTEEKLKNDPNAVRAFLKAARRGWMWTYNNTDKASTILNRNIDGSDKNILLAKIISMFNFIEKTKPKYLGVFPMEFSEWETTKDILVEYGGYPKDINIQKCFTNDFLPIDQ
jgi:ABC-type nitrate/sulfonate/bicarbonate transport system substrate-binding protein